MAVEIPQDIIEQSGRTEAEVKLELSIFFYVEFKMSSGRCARFAGIPRVLFLDELGHRGIPVNYDEKALKQDLETIDKILP
ncbi:MAG: UPF0175 family protein [Bacteroidetes bacterium]|nr:UPF0175 family protein [Bacteroidota bacterium]